MFSSKEASLSGFYTPNGLNDPQNTGRILFNPNPPDKGNNRPVFHQGWAMSEKKNNDPPRQPKEDPVRPLVNFCRKMLDHVHTESYQNFFQGLLADLTDEDFLGNTSLQPVPSAQQDGYVLLDENIIPGEAQFAEVTAPNGNYITAKIGYKNDLGFLILEKDPLTYAELYAELELKKISTLRVKFLRQLENTKE